MNWLFENPRSIVRMWNTLCDAVRERGEFYGIDLSEYFEHLPDVPCRKEISGTMMTRMNHAVRELVWASFDCRMLGQWDMLDNWMDDVGGGFDSPEWQGFRAYDIDGYALWHEPVQLPSRRHTVSQWMASAAKAVNFLVRYPRPLFDTSLVLDGILEAEDFCTGEFFRYSSAEKPLITIRNENGYLTASDSFAARYLAKCGRGRFYEAHWIYKENVLQKGYFKKFPSPVLKGKVPVLCETAFECMEDGMSVMSIPAVENKLEIDMDTKKSDGNLNFSAVSDAVNRCFEDVEKIKFSSADVKITLLGRKILLSEDNFKPLPYIYLE